MCAQHYYNADWKNCTMQQLKIKFYLVDKIKDLSPEDSLWGHSEGLLWKEKGGVRIHRSFAKKKKKKQIVEHQKITIKYKFKKFKKKKFRLMNLALCYAWEDARVCAKWNPSSDMHVNYLGPASSFLCQESHQGAQLGWLQGLMAWWQHALFRHWHFPYTITVGGKLVTNTGKIPIFNKICRNDRW